MYQTGKEADTVTLVVAQWTASSGAKKQYDALSQTLTGKALASGSVKVSGNATGEYSVTTDTKNSKKAVALWQNDTALFEASGSKDAVMRFYQQFPL